MMRWSGTLAVAVALGLVPALAARAQQSGDAPPKKAGPSVATSPEQAVLLLKAAWEAKDDAAIVARYADPGAASLRRDLAGRRKLDAAETALLAAAERLGSPSLGQLGLEDCRPTSPLTSGTLTIADVKVEGEKAVGRARIETLDGVREIRYELVHRQGDWKIVLARADGTPLEAGALTALAQGADAREKLAAEVDAATKDVLSGAIVSADTLARRLAPAVERERGALAKAAADAERSRRSSAGDKAPGPPPAPGDADGEEDER